MENGWNESINQTRVIPPLGYLQSQESQCRALTNPLTILQCTLINQPVGYYWKQHVTPQNDRPKSDT